MTGQRAATPPLLAIVRYTVRACVPAGYQRVDDGGVQQVMATTGFTLGAVDLIDMHGTTDHPGLLVSYTVAGTA